MNAIPVVRGCGTRKKGGVYAECGLSPFGQVIEKFLLDPIIPVDMSKIGMAPIKPVLRVPENPKAPTVIMDWIGSEYYPNPTDFVEESRRFGMSRRLEMNALEYKSLRPDTKLLAVHARAALAENEWYLYEKNILRHQRESAPFNEPPGMYEWMRCPTGKHLDGDGNHPLCAGWMWRTVIEGVKGESLPTYWVERHMPSFDYFAQAPLDLIFSMQAGAFLGMPITRIAVINDPEDGTHEKKLKKLDGCALPVEVVDE